MSIYINTKEFQLEESQYRLPEVAYMNTSKGGKKNEKLDKTYNRTKNGLSVFLFILIGAVSFVLLWNLKMAMGIDILPGAHHEFIDVINNSVGLEAMNK